jgi:hypothetical protein
MWKMVCRKSMLPIEYPSKSRFFPESSPISTLSFETFFLPCSEIVEPPHFATTGSLEYEFGMRWKKLLDDHQAQLQQTERMFQTQAEELEKEMAKSIDDFEINKIKQSNQQIRIFFSTFSNLSLFCLQQLPWKR